MKQVFDAVVFEEGKETKIIERVYTKAIKNLGEKYENVICLTADMTYLLEVNEFRDKFPNRAFDLGVAEQNMIGVASGMAQTGEVVFAHTFGCFLTRRALDQVVNAVAVGKRNVKMVGMMPGIASDGGPSHMAIDDIAIVRSIPNMTLLDLGDSTETEQAVEAAYKHEGPVYIRLRRGRQHHLFDAAKFNFEIGESYWIREGTDLTFISSGIMTNRALHAAALLEKQGVSTNVLHVPTIKPIDEEGIIEMASRSKAIITLDNHNTIGGLGTAVGEVLLEKQIRLPFFKIGINDRFGRAANEPYLAGIYGLEPDQIAQTSLAFLEGKEDPLEGVLKKEEVVATGGGWIDEWKN